MVVIDCRFDLSEPALGLTQYLEGHIPSAHYLHLNDDLSGPIIINQTGRHPLPNPDLLARKLGQIGIQSGARVVAYDHNHGAFAARLWWLLRWLGHDNVQVLDGGYNQWQAQALPIEDVVPTSPAHNLYRATAIDPHPEPEHAEGPINPFDRRSRSSPISG